MVSAYLLAEEHEVTVFEANDYIGGHTHTLDIEIAGSTYPVDTGFIVFNELTYPHFLELLKRLNVSWQNSMMSFSITCQRTGLEYKTSPLNALFAQRKNLLNPRFYRMLWDVFRFRKEAPDLLKQEDETLTLGAYLRENRYSQMFIDYFMIPMGAAIWSTSAETAYGFSGALFCRILFESRSVERQAASMVCHQRRFKTIHSSINSTVSTEYPSQLPGGIGTPFFGLCRSETAWS